MQEPESLDDLLNAKTPYDATNSAPNENLTRDTEVSKIISPEEAAGGQVTIIRGNERTNVQFGPEAVGGNNVPQ